MRVFISWSGSPSDKLATILSEWLPNVMQQIEPFTSEAIPKGAKWFGEVDKELRQAGFGICCVTPFNQKEPWLLFEAGALAMQLQERRVTPLVIGMEMHNLEQPLGLLQACNTGREDMLRLVQSINQVNGEQKLTEQQLERSFNKWWDELRKAIEDIESGIKDGKYGKVKKERPVDEMVAEILDIVRGISRVKQSQTTVSTLKEMFERQQSNALQKRFGLPQLSEKETMTFLQNVIRRGLLNTDPDFPPNIDIKLNDFEPN